MSRDIRSDVDPHDGRDETQTERSDRNWDEILQELRVIQTGTQILTGFLLTLPFQQRFGELEGYEVIVYLVLVVVSAVATSLALAPVALHRTLFRHRAKGPLVRIGNRLLKATLVAVGLTLAGTAMLVFDVVIDLRAGVIAGASGLLLVVTFWLVIPLIVKRGHLRD